MPTVKTVYLGEFRSEATHLQSGTKILTDAPTDNHGRGEAFSPTDLVATALGACMLTIMGQAAQTGGFDIVGTRVETTKIMASDPRRIGEIVIDVHLPSADYTPKQRAILERAAATCPVAKSLHPDTVQTVRYFYGD